MLGSVKDIDMMIDGVLRSQVSVVGQQPSRFVVDRVEGMTRGRKSLVSIGVHERRVTTLQPQTEPKRGRAGCLQTPSRQ